MVDHCIQLYVWVVKHPTDIEGIHLHNKFADADKVEAYRMECMEEAIQFDFGLGIAGLTLVPSDGAEAQGAAVSVGTILREDPSNTSDR